MSFNTPKPEEFVFSFKAMGSPCQLRCYTSSQSQAKRVFKRAFERIQKLEKRYSRYQSDSLISRINQSAGTGEKIAIDSETFALLNYAQQCYEESSGLFDVTSGILRQLWRFHESGWQIPQQKQIEPLLARIDWNKLKWNQQWAYLEQTGMELDFGGIVKEYAADSIASLCYEWDIQYGLINMGGDIRIFGPALMEPAQHKTGVERIATAWPIAIQHPFKRQNYLAELSIKSGAVASSGDYERMLEYQGKRYGHILNPVTGWPVEGLSAVTVIAEHCVVAGSLATIAMLKGKNGLQWLSDNHIQFIACDAHGEVCKSV